MGSSAGDDKYPDDATTQDEDLDNLTADGEDTEDQGPADSYDTEDDDVGVRSPSLGLAALCCRPGTAPRGLSF